MNHPGAVQALAGRHGVQLSFIDLGGQERVAGTEALLSVLQALGLPVHTEADAHDALQAGVQQPDLLDPVLVAWDGRLHRFAVRLPPSLDRAEYYLRLEDGSELSGALSIEQQHDGWLASIPQPLPFGYHEIIVEAGTQRCAVRVLSAPERAHAGRVPPDQRAWSAFLPLYSVRSAESPGIGDYGALADLMAWTGKQGGAYFGTLPLLATFLDEPFEPSPYSPVSRLFWSDVFLDLGALCRMVHEHVQVGNASILEATAALAHFNHADLVDYREVARVKRRAIEPLAQHYFRQQGAQSPQFQQFERDCPRARDYAAFRAAGDRLRTGWPVWPERLRNGNIDAADYDAASFEYHLFAQFAAAQQLAAAAAQPGAQLYLDLPLGVHPDGYDVWRERTLFAKGVATGSPPDAFFTQGQNWGFPPLNPNAQRADGYAYLRAAIQTHLRYAGALRLDHVMALHRVFWVPAGQPASTGVYVSSPADELYALLCLESHRHQALIIGEDLGTVPPEVREQMHRHHLARMYVVQFEIQPHAPDPLPVPPAQSVASLNTHDMPSFEGYRRALDAEVRAELNLIGPDEVVAIRHERRVIAQSIAHQLERAGFLHPPAEPEQVRDALLAFLAASPARLLLVNLEDLWREERPQNVPGTSGERPNWRRRTRPTLEEIMNSPDIAAVLSRLNEIRREN